MLGSGYSSDWASMINAELTARKRPPCVAWGSVQSSVLRARIRRLTKMRGVLESSSYFLVHSRSLPMNRRLLHRGAGVVLATAVAGLRGCHHRVEWQQWHSIPSCAAIASELERQPRVITAQSYHSQIQLPSAALARNDDPIAFRSVRMTALLYTSDDVRPRPSV